MILPSNKLLSEVLDKSVIIHGIEQHTYPKTSDSFVIHYEMHYEDKTYGERTTHRYINIYELTHKFKEWAFKQGYGICSISSFGNGSSYAHIEQITDYGLLVTSESKAILGKTEPEAIFKACEYILNIGNKND